MKQKIKILSFLGAITLFMFMMIASEDWDPAPPNSPKLATVDLSGDYLGLCSSFYEGVKPLLVTISIDRYTGSGTFEANYKTYKKTVTNQDLIAGSSFQFEKNFKFTDIEVPKTGSFGITATIDVTTCFACCSAIDGCTATNAQGFTSQGGKPYFRGISTVINSAESTTYFRVIPLLAQCF